MNTLHKESNNDKHIVPKEGQRDFLCSNNKSFRCPSLGCDTRPFIELTKIFKMIHIRLSNTNKNEK